MLQQSFAVYDTIYMMKQLLIGLVILFTVIGVVWYLSSNRAQPPKVAGVSGTQKSIVQTLTVTEFSEKVADSSVILLDIRTPEEFATGALINARNVDFYAPGFTAELNKLDKTKTYAIYCNSGNRTKTALAKMKDLGFISVYELSGGITAWKSAGKEVAR